MLSGDMFKHKHTVFNDIDDLYTQTILPQLLPLEDERKKFWRSFKITAPILVMIILAIAGFVYVRSSQVGALIFGFIFSSAGVGGLYSYKSKGVRRDSKSILMSAISHHIGLIFQNEVTVAREAIAELQQLKLLPSTIDRSHFEDSISGKFDDVDIKICEAKLEREVRSDKGKRWQTIFRGSLLEMDFHRDFLGTTIVLRDGGIFNSKRKGDMKRIGLASPKFEKIFEAYGTDQVEGRYLLTPTFMEKLMELEESVEGKKIRFAFSKGKLHVAVEHANRFETKNLRQPITDAARVQTVIDELESVLSIISIVSQPEKKRYS